MVQVGSSSRNNNNNLLVSLFQEGSSISDSSSIAVNNKCVLLPEHPSVDHESTEVFIDFGFEFPYDLINGLDCNEKVSLCMVTMLLWGPREDASYFAFHLG
ncbi:hypothetical protein Lal_00003014 [Lupinus albus]|nr:hypothetical protein Lal_00003014 [Lupinus albus]